MNDEKVIVKLVKQPLSSERAEIKAKRKRTLLIIVLCLFMLISGTGLGFVVSGLSKGSNIAIFKQNKFEKILSYYESLWLYKNDYDDLDTYMQDNAFYGMSQFEEDDYSTYMSKEDVDDFATYISKNYVGIGAQYSLYDDVATITRVFNNSPAKEAGLFVGDILYKVNGESIKGLSADEIKAKIVGEDGTSVNITVIRANQEVELNILRKSIDYTVYAEVQDDYVYLEIMSFADSTVNQCIGYLEQYKDYEKIIIDLRDNGGGYQSAVQDVAGLFIGPNKTVLKETDNTGVTKSYSSGNKAYYDNFKKYVILTNGNTASAAEVLTICLKEQLDDVTQVGLTTYGKGVVQSTYYLGDGSAVKITTSYWSSPNDVSINKVGVSPDIEIRLDDILYETVYQMKEDEQYYLDSVSDAVAIAQKALAFLDYDVDRKDGYFSYSFKRTLTLYQIDNNLDITGTLNYETYSNILHNISYEYNTNKTKDAQLMKAIEILGE